MFLTKDELEELTNRVIPSAQHRMLQAMGIEHKRRPDGTVVVLKSHVEQVLGARAATQAQKLTVVPNWSAVR